MSTSSNQARIKHTVSILKATTYSNADISAYYFSAVLDAFDEEVEGVFRCQCGTLHRQSPRTGYSNLMSHIRDQHHDYQEVVMEADMGAGTLAPWIKQSAKNMHGWLDWIISSNLQLQFCKRATTRRAKTSLRPVLRQDTRWSSTYAMVGRYFCLAGFIEADDEDMCELMPSPRSVKRLLSLLSDLKRIEYVSKSLQCETTTILDVRLWFDGLIEVEPSFAEYLAPRARIVHSPDFESGCTKVLDGEGAKLTWAESAALEPFAIELSESEFDSESGSSTSNMVERFQSRPRHVWTRAPFTEPVHARNDFVSC
ncbi:hypothetical protein AM587_10002115 [Phytophthora nicotianae]|uniref:Uncharacterized protein n=1 Tax=Phytophthora nicotianae TaxID=4792 RepID=A0A0W8DGE6_PHYNI|nr:hypothetical protein AM587_10002115 [Phytophthora nicotianae]